MLAQSHKFSPCPHYDRTEIVRSYVNLVLRINQRNEMNKHSNPFIRKATVHDAEQLAKLIDIAGEGIPNWLWSKSSNASKTPLEIGAERAKRTSGGFSYTNAHLIENHGQSAGMILGYAINEVAEENPDDLPAPIAPFVELEKYSVGTWYINALAVFSEHRRQGLGSHLMRQTERIAKSSGYEKMSIQVFGQNVEAVKLYKHLGYKIIRSAPVRLHPCQPYYTGDVLLLTKHIDVD